MLTLAFTISALAGTFRDDVGARIVGIVVSVTTLPVLWALQRREHRLRHVIAISPFGVSEIRPDGGTRTVLFSQPLTLENRPRRRRLELRPTGSREHIALSYSLVALDEAVELIVHYGGFTADDRIAH